MYTSTGVFACLGGDAGGCNWYEWLGLEYLVLVADGRSSEDCNFVFAWMVAIAGGTFGGCGSAENGTFLTAVGVVAVIANGTMVGAADVVVVNVSFSGCCISISPVSWGSTIMLDSDDDGTIASFSSDAFIRGMDNGRGIIINRDKLLGRCGMVDDDAVAAGSFDIKFVLVTGTSSMDMDRTCCGFFFF
jgi:hypothetical protein